MRGKLFDPARPLLCDLYCGEGGAAMGYWLAGFQPFGVDRRPQRRYPFPFIQADALGFLASARLGTVAAVHASPPCQGYSKRMRHFTSGYPLVIGDVRRSLAATGLPWVIENVVGAPLPEQDTLDGGHGLLICGTMLGLPVWYHRLFETSFPAAAPRGCDHRSSRPLNPRCGWGPGRDTEAEWRQAIGVPWTSQQGGREAIPPAYTECVGSQLRLVLSAACRHCGEPLIPGEGEEAGEWRTAWPLPTRSGGMLRKYLCPDSPDALHHP